MKKSIVIASLLLSACAPSVDYIRQVQQHCNQVGKTRLEQVSCTCDNITAAYEKGQFTEGYNGFVMSCAKQKYFAEKIDKKEMTDVEAENAYNEWQYQFNAQQAQQEAAQRAANSQATSQYWQNQILMREAIAPKPVIYPTQQISPSQCNTSYNSIMNRLETRCN